MEIYLATNNKHKAEELQQILTKHKIIIPNEKGIDFQFDETGKTYFENSFGKAKALYDIVKLPVIADDSGLSVKALDGAPGIFSARFGDSFDKKLTQKEKNQTILNELKSEKCRDASFICCLVFIKDENNFISVQESFDGEISLVPKGDNGFGYDPIFKVKNRDITVAQLSEEEKNQISHRAKAGAKLNKLISEL